MIFAKQLLALLPLIVVLSAAPIAQAQNNPFAPAFTVNGRVVSNYELKQRIIFYSLLEPNGDATTEGRTSLIDDRLRQYAAELAGTEVSPEEIAAGMESFASRLNLSADEFIKELAPRGASAETFRDFVTSGLLWRATIRAKFQASTAVTDAQIDRAIADGIAAGGELKVLLSEIVLKTDGPNDAAELALRIKGDVNSSAGFSAAAGLYSAAPTASRGGQLDWMPISQLPPAIAPQVAELEIGQMSEPIVDRDTVLLLYVRDRSSSGAVAEDGTSGQFTGPMAVDFVRLVVAPGTDIVRITADLDRCEDLLPFGRDLPEEAVLRETLAEAAVPSDIALGLRALDAGESRSYTTSAGQTAILMLCSRQPLTEIAPSRDDVRSQILNKKLALRAQAYLEELRTEAFIIEP
jgi:peptidyl-prolyl cis-trans isomerase SurA